MGRKPPPVATPDDPQWYRDAVVYEVHVRAFQDSSGDGVGDFGGLRARLDYVRDLGVTALWLLPFYPSPWRDDGYDISDYSGVHPAYGSLRDFTDLVDEAHRRGLRVITELVLNHTSDRHPWFQRARRAPPGSRLRDFYVWSDTPERYREARVIFKDFEASNWTWDPVAKAYFWHRFYAHQPDLNFANPAVRRAMLRVVDFWLKRGVDGLRLDAVPYLFERDGTTCENLPETHEFLRALRAHVDARYRDRLLLAEANQWPEDAIAYFGAGDECHMGFHFPLMPRLFMAIRREERFPILEILRRTPPIPASCQWGLFLRNHDELTLEMVTDEERDYMYRVYADDPQARVNLGIRRRLAPLLGNNRRKVELVNGLLLSLPGTPFLYYGDEIGMGDNIYLGDRNSVRTPMQWSGDRNGGFSRANPQRLYLPLVVDPEYHYEAVNVEAQAANPQSLLGWMRRLIALRKRHAAFGRGTLEFLHPANRKVLAFLRRHDGETLLVVANLSRFVQHVALDLGAFPGWTPIELFGRTRFPPVAPGPTPLTLGPHSFYWFSLEAPRSSGSPSGAGTPVALPTIRLAAGWPPSPEGPDRAAIEEALPAILARRPWFSGGRRTMRTCSLIDAVPIGATRPPRAAVLLVRLEYADGEPEVYALPAILVPGDPASEVASGRPGSVWATVEDSRGSRLGVLADASVDPVFGHDLFAGILRRRRWHGTHGDVAASPEPAAARALAEVPPEALTPAPLASARRHVSVAYGSRYLLKLSPRVEKGPAPAVEIARALAPASGERWAGPALAGTVEYHAASGDRYPMGVLETWVPHEGDAWQFTLDVLGRYYERVLGPAGPDRAPLDRPSPRLSAPAGQDVGPVAAGILGTFTQAVDQLGRRTAEVHAALGSIRDDPAFSPEPFDAYYRRALHHAFRTRAERALAALRGRREDLPPAARAEADRLLSLEAEIERRQRAVIDRRIVAERIRIHGDLRLQDVLATGTDFVITDFGGATPVGERRLKRCALRDVASMLWSFEDAAHAALADHVARGYAPAGDRSPLGSATAADAWCAWAGAGFLRAYLAVAEGREFLPRSREDVGATLDAFRLDFGLAKLESRLESAAPEAPGAPGAVEAVEAVEAIEGAAAGLLRVLDLPS